MNNDDNIEYYELQQRVRSELSDDLCTDVQFPKKWIGTEFETMFEAWLDLMLWHWFPTGEDDDELFYTICIGVE